MKLERWQNNLYVVLALLWIILVQTGCISGLLISLTGCTNGQSSTAWLNDLELKMETNQSQAHVGEPVRIRFTVTNRGSRMDLAESNDKPAMDISVSVVGGETLQEWSAQNPDKVSHHLEWQPGESKTIEWMWVPKPGDIYDGEYRSVFVSGVLQWSPEHAQVAHVRICASNFCR